ncbi:MAG: hypothetical protein QM703_13870 [Gemmatales bacterium]
MANNMRSYFEKWFDVCDLPVWALVHSKSAKQNSPSDALYTLTTETGAIHLVMFANEEMAFEYIPFNQLTVYEPYYVDTAAELMTILEASQRRGVTHARINDPGNSKDIFSPVIASLITALRESSEANQELY